MAKTFIEMAPPPLESKKEKLNGYITMGLEHGFVLERGIYAQDGLNVQVSIYEKKYMVEVVIRNKYAKPNERNGKHTIGFVGFEPGITLDQRIAIIRSEICKLILVLREAIQMSR